MTDVPERQGRVPPVEHRFKPGQSGNPGGMPKGAKYASPRRALLRALGKDADKDTEAAGEDDRLGAMSLDLARQLLEAARNGDAEKVRAIATVIDQAEGKPTEHVIQEATGERTVILRNPPPPQPLPEGD